MTIDPIDALRIELRRQRSAAWPVWMARFLANAWLRWLERRIGRAVR